MAIFEDSAVFTAQRHRNRCDNTIYRTASTGSTVPPDWNIHGVTARMSIRYAETQHYADQLVDREVVRMLLGPTGMSNVALLRSYRRSSRQRSASIKAIVV